MVESTEKTTVTEPRKLGLGCKALVALMVVVTVGLGVGAGIALDMRRRQIEMRRREDARREIQALYEGARQDCHPNGPTNGQAGYLSCLKDADEKLALADEKIAWLQNDALWRAMPEASRKELDQVENEIERLRVLVRLARKRAAVEKFNAAAISSESGTATGSK